MGPSSMSAAALRNPRSGALWVLAISGLLGFRVGMVGFASWHVPVETAQVIAGIVEYPAGNPFYIYHTKLWTVLHQVCAVLLLSGVSEITLSMFLSGLLGMIGIQALSLFVYALSHDAWLAVGSAFVVFFSRAAEYGVTYPVMLMGTPDTYGALGLSTFVLVVALLGAGCYRLGGFLLGLAPAVHPSLGAWFGLTVALALLWDFRRLREELRPGISYFLVGAAVTTASLVVQLLVTYDVPRVDPSVSARYLDAFVAFWDAHRHPVNIASPGVILNGAALVLALVWLMGPGRDLSRSAGFLLRIVFVGAALSLAFVFLSWVPPGKLPQNLVILMPSRLLNFNVMTFTPLLFGLIAACRGGLWSDALIGTMAAGLLLGERSRFWEWAQQRGWLAGQGRFDQLVVIAAASVGLLCLAAATSARSSAGRASGAGQSTTPGPFAAKLGRLTSVSVLAAAVALSWRVRPDYTLLDRTNDPFFAQMAAERTGLVATAGSFHLVQLYTRRPVLIDGGALDTLSYAPESGPAMDQILRDVYGIDLFHPPSSIVHGAGVIPHEFNEGVWEGFSPEKWQEIRRSYNVTQVLTRAGWELALPIAGRSASFTLYRIPD